MRGKSYSLNKFSYNYYSSQQNDESISQNGNFLNYLMENRSTTSFVPNTILIAPDSLSCLQSLKSYPFNSHLFLLIFRLKSIVTRFHLFDYTIQFLWNPGHVDIHSNEITDSLVKSPSHLIPLSIYNLPFFDS